MRSAFHSSVFCHLPAWKLLSMGALPPRRRRCSSALQRDSRVLAAMFFYGVILWLAAQSDPHPAPLFAHFFWQGRKSGSAKQPLRCYRDNGSSGANRKCRADRVVGPYKAPCRIVCEATSAALPQIRRLRCQPENPRQHCGSC